MRTRILLFLLCGALFHTCEKDHTDPDIKEISDVRGYRNIYIGEFRCGLYVPKNYDRNKSYPLIIYLHGYTDTITWNLEWYNDPIATSDPCFVLTPKCPSDETDGWGSSFGTEISPSIEKSFEMLGMVEKAFHLDRNRYYIYGTSMGGVGTYAVIQNNPDLFAAGYVLCGAGDVTIAPVIAALPFWIFHGSNDNVIYVEYARNMYQAVLNAGGRQIRYTEYVGVGHNVWDYTRNETTLPKWLLAQHKGSVHTAPKALEGFRAELAENNRVDLQWEVPAVNPNPSDDNLWYCRIYRNGSIIKNIYNDQNTFTDSTVLVNNTYSYRIAAVNYYFKESGMSETFSIEIPE